MTEQPKLCKDCLHYKKSWSGHLLGSSSLDKCYNPILTNDLITGDIKSKSCEDAREYEMYCGKSGKYFEPLWGDRK